MASYKFTAKPKWRTTRFKFPEEFIVEANTIEEAKCIARLSWAMQGRLPNNTTIKELG